MQKPGGPSFGDPEQRPGLVQQPPATALARAACDGSDGVRQILGRDVVSMGRPAHARSFRRPPADGAAARSAESSHRAAAGACLFDRLEA